jgi:hypothetical protein
MFATVLQPLKDRHRGAGLSGPNAVRFAPPRRSCSMRDVMKRGRFKFLAALIVCLYSVLWRPAPAGASDHLDSDRPEAWAMFYYTSVSLFSGLGTPRSRKPGSIEVGFELGSIPHLDPDQRRVGFDGTKEEDLNKSPIFARARLTIGLPWKLALILGYVPPISVFGVRPHLLDVGLERPIYERGPWTLGLRAYGQIGDVTGAFTCPASAAEHPPGSPGNPYGCDGTSNDKAKQRYLGLELSGSYRIDGLRGLTPWVTISGNYLDTTFDVNAVTFDVPDTTHLEAETGTMTLGFGARYPLTEKIDVSIGMSFTPLWVTRPPSTSSELDSLLNVRTVLSYRFR